MSNGKQKLELTWIGKDEQPKLEPRILIEDPAKSYGDKNSENMLIFGDNLLALKALEQDFANKIKCIYIDPPYNTGEAFQEYDDSKEHSIWLSLMKERFLYLRILLSNNGVLFVQLNDEEMAYCKVLLDEIFGRYNFINQIAVKTKNTAGASGGGEDKRLKKNVEFILAYAKDYDSFSEFNESYDEENLFELIDEMENSGKSWKYTSVLIDKGKFLEERTIKDGSGNPIKIRKYKGLKRTTVNKLISSGQKREDVYFTNFQNIFSDTNAQSSIRERVINEFKELDDDELLVVNYVPKSGRDKGLLVEHLYLSPSIRRVIWLKDSAEIRNKTIIKKEKTGTYWDGFNWNNVNKEGGVVFTGGKKPETLVQKVIELVTNKEEYVLDSFLGSGTTAAVAQKTNRKWIGIEMGEHCHTHCIPRLKAVIDGADKGGITEAVAWQGGGGFKYYYLAPTLVLKDKNGMDVINEQYNPQMLAAAMAKQEGFKYSPDAAVYWKQGKSTEKDYIFTTTQFVTVEFLDKIHDEMASDDSLLICCKSFSKACEDRFPNITIKKIPNILLGRCEFGRDNYNLNIVTMPEGLEYEGDEDEQAEPKAKDKAVKKEKSEKKGKNNDKKQRGLFEGDED
jgi:adenine-specific DNA-methyltransferase